jgi:hypothetical protein
LNLLPQLLLRIQLARWRETANNSLRGIFKLDKKQQVQSFLHFCNNEKRENPGISGVTFEFTRIDLARPAKMLRN